jgi:cyclic pyranopterin phosphate synthase
MARTLSHLDASGRVRMVDVGGKRVTTRSATARGRVFMHRQTLALLRSGRTPKGDVLATAQLAGVMAAKRVSELVPLAHVVPLDHVEVGFSFDEGTSSVGVEARVRARGRTGVEMEALTAVQVGLLTIYDMCKAVDRGMTMEAIRLLEKRGGKSGAYVAP